MSILKRQRKNGVVYLVCTRYKGKKYYDKPLRDRREAERLNKRRRAEVRAGTYHPTASAKRTVASYVETWLAGRRGRNADNDASVLRRLVLSREWFAEMPMEDVRKPHALRMLSELRESKSEETGKPLSEKYLGNVIGLLSTMWNDAVDKELVQTNPFRMKRGTIRRSSSGSARSAYEASEIVQIVGCQELSPMARMFATLAFYTGMREGEVCGRRWRDWDPGPEPLTCLTVSTQYDGKPLKTEWGPHGEHPRRVPVHPDLERLLTWWKTEGFALQYARAPTPDDFIVPNRDGSPHTRSSAYKMWRRMLAKAGVGNRSLHSTRHSFITHCRRGGASKDKVELVTHNAKGDIVDQYTHMDWAPLCAVVSCLNIRPGGTLGVTTRREDVENKVEAQGIEVGGRLITIKNNAAIRELGDGSSATRNTEECAGSAAKGDACSPHGVEPAISGGEAAVELLRDLVRAVLDGDEGAREVALEAAARALDGVGPRADGRRPRVRRPQEGS